jgi:transcriptional regulator with XRE-family HTH domain
MLRQTRSGVAGVNSRSSTPNAAHIGSDMVMAMRSPGTIIAERRRAHGLTQAQLALRAGTSQAAISRLERDELSPTFETFERLLGVMGETFDVRVRRLRGDYDHAHLADLRARSPAERLELAMSWNKLAGEIAAAGQRARGV